MLSLCVGAKRGPKSGAAITATSGARASMAAGRLCVMPQSTMRRDAPAGSGCAALVLLLLDGSRRVPRRRRHRRASQRALLARSRAGLGRVLRRHAK
mmetsp:Transcript_18513/g.59491  ORF Transcript_18513/g.59491 Transcript_18513/m.59491 type:complete len:97 (-) Transcript_18513:440-730(-)